MRARTKVKIFAHGWAIIWASFLLTLLIWIATLADYNFIFHDTFLFFSKITALLGTVGMCWTFILSTRLYFLEAMFSGLDKVYHTHRLLGILSFSLICFHPLFQIFRFIPFWVKGFNPLVLYKFGSVELGILAFLLFVTLISITLWIRIPYHIWKQSHEFFIFVLLIAFFHTIWIDKQVNDSLLLSIWLYGFMFLAFISYIYIRFLYWYIGPKLAGKIVDIEKRGKILNIYLSLSDKRMQYNPAQFIYISFDNPKLGKEPHPFSISSSPDQEALRISIKKLGDFTSKVDELQIGDKALIWGPYGWFSEKFLYETKKDVVMIAGGIGVSPFLSMLQFEADHPCERNIYIFYCIKNPSRAYFHQEIESLTERRPSIIYIPWYSDTQGLLNIEKLQEKIVDGLKNKLYFLCGPLSMMELFIRELNQTGVKNKSILFEDFNLLD